MKPTKLNGAKVRIPAFGTRPIRTEYYAATTRRQLIKTTHARWATKAVPNAVFHMQFNEYDAQLCEVWDCETGELHAQIKRDVNGNIRIVFLREVRLGGK